MRYDFMFSLPMCVSFSEKGLVCRSDHLIPIKSWILQLKWGSILFPHCTIFTLLPSILKSIRHASMAGLEFLNQSNWSCIYHSSHTRVGSCVFSLHPYLPSLFQWESLSLPPFSWLWNGLCVASKDVIKIFQGPCKTGGPLWNAKHTLKGGGRWWWGR